MTPSPHSKSNPCSLGIVNDTHDVLHGAGVYNSPRSHTLLTGGGILVGVLLVVGVLFQNDLGVWGEITVAQDSSDISRSLLVKTCGC